MSHFNTNCPHFNVGKCSSSKTCKYKYHKICPDNFLCEYEDCEFGHGISYMKRIIIVNIYDKKYFGYRCNDNKCRMPMNCINKNCEYEHPIDYEDRAFIYNIIDHSISDENALSNYEKKYTSYSPATSTMSTNSTVPALCSPCPVVSSPPPLTGSFVSCFKKEAKEPDDMLSIIEDMKNIRSDIDADTKKVDSIKEQIKKLQEELYNTEEKIKEDKNKLKELAVKIAEC